MLHRGLLARCVARVARLLLGSHDVDVVVVLVFLLKVGRIQRLEHLNSGLQAAH